MDRSFTIFGAGLAGTLMAVMLARRGHRVDLFERRPDPRRAGAERGRSINLALSTRGIEALRRAGLADEVLATAIPMRGRMIHPQAASPALMLLPYSRDPAHHINSVSRAGLNITLLNAAERQPGVAIHFGVRCLGVDFESSRASVLDLSIGSTRTIDTHTVIAADGAFSGVRSSMMLRDRFDYSQSYLPHGYKELTIPPADAGGWRMEPNALHIWPRGTYMMIALPNQDGSFTCTLFWPFEGPHSFAALRSREDILRFFDEHFPDSLPLIPALADDFLHNPTSSLVTVRCSPWHVGGRAVLVGDAAHAVVPFYGQGMNCSFEDCAVLDECLSREPRDLETAFAEYGRLRKPNTDALADLAIANFIEMRDKVNDPEFIFRRKVDHALEALFPEYRSLYEMVTFTTIPYAEASARAARAEHAVDSLALSPATARSLGELAIRLAQDSTRPREARVNDLKSALERAAGLDAAHLLARAIQ